MVKGRWFAAIAAALALAAAAAAADAGACTKGAWIPGHWEWDGSMHVWVPAHRQLPRSAYAYAD